MFSPENVTFFFSDTLFQPKPYVYCQFNFTFVPEMIRKVIEKLYHSLTGSMPVRIDELSAAGSNRNYFRVYGNPVVIAVYGTSTEENNAFIYLSSFFKQTGIPVPEIYIYSEDKKVYLQEDLGDTLLFDAIEQGRKTGNFTLQEKELLKQTIELLPAIQFAGQKGLDYTQCYPQPGFNKRSIFWDLNYFKYCFLKISGLDFQEDHLEDDFERMSHFLLKEEFDTFMYRDFQSRNVMITPNGPFLIDFQGGRKGPVYYDMASFLWQAKAGYPDELKEELIQTYLTKLQVYQPTDENLFRIRLKHFVLFRTLQVLGAYGFRGFFEKKSHFIQSIPFALANLKKLMEEGFPEYPYFSKLLNQLSEIRFTDN